MCRFIPPVSYPPGSRVTCPPVEEAPIRLMILMPYQHLQLKPCHSRRRLVKNLHSKRPSEGGVNVKQIFTAYFTKPTHYLLPLCGIAQNPRAGPTSKFLNLLVRVILNIAAQKQMI